MSHFLNEENLKDEYSEYIKESQVFPKLLTILEKLKATDLKNKTPMDFIREELGDKPIPVETIINLEHDINDARAEIKRLQGILRRLGVDYSKVNPIESATNPDADNADKSNLNI